MGLLIVVLIELERNNFVMFLVLPLRNYRIDRFIVPGTPVVSNSHTFDLPFLSSFRMNGASSWY